MSDRRAQIVRLLETRDEHLPEPVHRSEASAGFVHRAPARVSCPDCLANGRSMFGCETCGGRGYTEPMRERDPYAVDKVQPYGLTPDRKEAEQARERQIAVLDRQLRPASQVDEARDANASPYAWERARARMYRDHDYLALDRAVEWLRGVLPDASLYGGMAFGYLDVVLPDPLRAPAAPAAVVSPPPNGRAAGGAALGRRDAAIRSAIAGGAPTSHVSASFGLSVSQINRIVA